VLRLSGTLELYLSLPLRTGQKGGIDRENKEIAESGEPGQKQFVSGRTTFLSEE